MKKVLIPILALVLALGLALPVAAHTEADPFTTDLIADGGSVATEIDVGDVSVWNDSTNLYVQYVVDDPWVMTGSHLYVGKTDPANFPSTPGQFPYSPGMEKSPSPGASYDSATMTYTIPLAEIYAYVFVGKGEGKGLNTEGDPGVEPCNDVYIAAHANLEKLSDVMTVTLASGTQTLSAGYTETEPVDPLDPANYSGLGTWSAAVPVSSPPIPPWVDPSVVLPGAVWVSSAATTEGGFGDQWRLFKEALIPPGAVITSASLTMTADNAVEAYLNGISVGTTGDVYGTAPSPQHYNFNKLWGPYTLTPLVGPNILMFVVRNWVHTAYNPTGLIYKLDYEYQLLVTETGWGEGDPFGKNWAMYFEYHIQEPIVEERYPEEGNVYIGYEDWGNGDFDYNDFGMYFSAVETYQQTGAGMNLTKVTMTFTAKIFDSGGTHLIHIKRNIVGNSTYTVDRGGATAYTGETPEGSYTATGDVDVVLFNTAKYSWPQKHINETVTVEIVVGDPSSNPKGTPTAPRWDLHPFMANYDPWEIGTSGIINGVAWHIGDMQLVTGVTGSKSWVLDSRLVGQTLPYILVVPSAAWIPPWEDSSISGPRLTTTDYGPYGYFYDYYSTGGTSHPTWYNEITDSYVGLGGLSW